MFLTGDKNLVLVSLDLSSALSPKHTTKHLHSVTFVLHCVMFMVRKGCLGNSVFSLDYLEMNNEQ